MSSSWGVRHQKIKNGKPDSTRFRSYHNAVAVGITYHLHHTAITQNYHTSKPPTGLGLVIATTTGSVIHFNFIPYSYLSMRSCLTWAIGFRFALKTNTILGFTLAAAFTFPHSSGRRLVRPSPRNESGGSVIR